MERELDEMRDEDKTREQLIAELQDLRRTLADLRREIAEFERSEVDFIEGARIGEILIEMEFITHSQLHRSLERQKKEDILKHKRLGEIMVEEGLITKEERGKALVEQQKRLRHGI